MPSNFLLLLPLVGGYLFNHIYFRRRFRAQSATGHRLVFEAAVAGLLFLLIARLIVFIVGLSGIPAWISTYWPTLTNRTPFAGTVVLSLVLAPVAAIALNLAVGHTHSELFDHERFAGKRRYLRWTLMRWHASREHYLNLAIGSAGNALQKLLHEVAVRGPIDGITVGLTMDNKKIYAGAVTRSPNLSSTDEFVSLLPIMSGHRDEKTLSPSYDFVYPVDKFDRLSQSSEHGVVVALPISEIKSAHMLDVDYYEAELSRLKKDTPPHVAPDPEQPEPVS